MPTNPIAAASLGHLQLDAEVAFEVAMRRSTLEARSISWLAGADDGGDRMLVDAETLDVEETRAGGEGPGVGGALLAVDGDDSSLAGDRRQPMHLTRRAPAPEETTGQAFEVRRDGPPLDETGRRHVGRGYPFADPGISAPCRSDD